MLEHDAADASWITVESLFPIICLLFSFLTSSLSLSHTLHALVKKKKKNNIYI